MSPSNTSPAQALAENHSFEPTPSELWTSISGAERQKAVVRLSSRLHEMSELARVKKLPDLQTLLADLSASFLDASAEIAFASYGPFVIERLFSSVRRISQNLVANNDN